MATIRNEKLDIVRGVAAVLVLAGHTLQVYEDCSSNLLYNFITSVQMPLFMLIAGYAIAYSKPISNFQDLKQFWIRRSISLLLPWFVWSVLVYLLMKRVSIIEHIKYVAYHMEGAIWFLFSLWSISMLFGIALYLNRKITGKKKIYLIICTCALMDLALLLIGEKIGITFLGIKYTVYYFVFYLLGWLLNKIDLLKPSWKEKKHIQLIFALCLVLFATAISKITIVDLPDSSIWVMIRFAVSLIGCFCIYYYVNLNSISGIAKRVFVYLGSISLELYVVQYVLINIFVRPAYLSIQSVEGFVDWFFYFCIIAVICCLIIKVLSASELSKLLFFGKKR